LREPSETFVERLNVWSSGEREHQWVGQTLLDVLDEPRADPSALKLGMHEDIDEIGVVDPVADSPGEADEKGVLESERLRNTVRKGKLYVIGQAWLPPNEGKESSSLVPRNL
jgi:hypothetical protein